MRLCALITLLTTLSVGCTSKSLPRATKQLIPRASTANLEAAIRSLPPPFFADCPYEGREEMLDELHADPADRLDLENEWLHYFSDGGPVRTTSMIHLRLYKRREGTKVAFVHMPKPFANGSAPSDRQTFVLTPDAQGTWSNVTQLMIPKEVDITAHFSPLRHKNVIEVAPYLEKKHPTQGRIIYDFGECQTELLWDGDQFKATAVTPRKL